MAKKLSVAEILAAARAEKKQGEGATPAAENVSTPPTPAQPEATPPQATSESVAASSETPAAPTPPAKPASAMSVAEILAAARAGKPGGAKPAEQAPAESAPAPAAPAKPASAMSVAEIMAAARAAKGGGAAPAAATPAQPAAAAPAAPAAKAEPAAPVSSGPKDTASILAAARKASKPGPISKAEAAAKAAPAAPAAKQKIEVPPMPARPDYARPTTAAQTQDRRGFLAAGAALIFGSPLAIGFATLAVTHVMWLLGLARFMFPNVLIEPPTRFKVGFPDTLAPGQVETKYIPQFGVWIVKYEYEGTPMIYALKAVCTHLGCTPNWLEAEQKFKCPCHGSGFYKDGINFEGPAPRPLERYAISIADDGQLLVDKSRTFNQELGGWKDPASYVTV